MPDTDANASGLGITRIALFTLFAVCLASVPSRAGNQVWTGVSPRAKSIQEIVRDPLNPQRMWAASFGAGVYRSLDGGATWTAYRTGLINTFVRCLAVQPRHPDSVYCGANDGVYLSTDGGQKWTRLLATVDTQSRSVRALAIDPIRSGTVYAGTYGLGVEKSINGGATWTPINLGLANNLIRAIAINPAKPETVLAGAGTGFGVQRSFNGGLQWNIHPVLDTTATTGAVEKIVFDPADPARIYAAMIQKGVIRSRNGGDTWVRINGGLPTVNSRSLVVVNGDRYLGTADAGAFHAIMPNDSTWLPANTGLGNPVVDAMLSTSGSPGTVWAGTDGGGIFRTDNSGAGWAQLDGGLLDTYDFSITVRPSNHELYLGTGFGDQFWRSTDQAATWTHASFLFTHDSEHGVAADPVAASTVYLSAYGAGVYRSLDDGATWIDPDSLNATLTNRFVRPLIAWPGQSGHLLVGAGDGVWESTDGGAHWAPKGSGLPFPFSVRSLALAPGVPAIYAGSDTAGVYRVNGTGVWAQKNVGLKGLFVHALVVDAAIATTVYAATDSGLFKSTDSADNWVQAGTGLAPGTPRALAQDPVHPSVLFCGVSGAGVYESGDGGSHWALLGNPSNLPNLTVRSLAVDAALATVYAGTDGGVAAYTTYPLWALAVEPEGQGAGLSLAVGPNPARTGLVRVQYGLPRAGHARVELFGLRGERVRELEDREESAGVHTLMWDGHDREGRPAAPGMYFVRLESAAGTRAARVVLLTR